uniref:Kunitz-type serine protease inhibitor bitisilin-3-like n=1 Tax=Sinocyclocheilus grahami TaxID=75366 RepID=A0A672MJG0_SINGR
SEFCTTLFTNHILCLLFPKNLAACSLTADVGTGSESEVRAYMYYDAEKDNCYPFRYFGSGGNANRFITERQCMRNCSNRADELFPKDGKNIIAFIYEIQACYLPKKPGECVGHYLRYYYSPEHHKCKSFYWTGCVGNGNRFLTLSCYMLTWNFLGLAQRNMGKRMESLQSSH